MSKLLSLKEMYEKHYPFSEAKRDLFELIENSFNDKESIVIPNKIATSLFYNKSLAKTLFDEIDDLGYKVKFLDEVTISINLFIDTVSLDLCNYLKQGLSDLIDSNNPSSLILDLIVKYPKYWKKNAKGIYNPYNSLKFKTSMSDISINLDEKRVYLGEGKSIFFDDIDIQRFVFTYNQSKQNPRALERSPTIRRPFNSEMDIFCADLRKIKNNPIDEE